ncbi:MAG: Uma2 family endonuclease [Deltaproteobacteria bacterium]|nr:Uma2 family endonuclease [Deltaproteobacteria bacterium]
MNGFTDVRERNRRRRDLGYAVAVSAAARPRPFEDLYREIQQLPEGQRGEILDVGEIHVTMGRPGRPHRHAAKVLQGDLNGVDRAMGGTGWWIEVEPEVRFGERLLDPDLAGWRVERVPVMPRENPITVPPDWCCEVLSPRTRRDDRRKKLPIYVRAGVAQIWLVDPEARLIEVFVPVDGNPTLIATASDEEPIRLPPFELDLHPVRYWLDEGT